jgi:16S rRNA processing protein RimM
MEARADRECRYVQLGHIAGVHGVRGWVKIHSETEPREAIFEYQPWLLGAARREVRLSEGRRHGKRLIALLEGVEDRDQAEELLNEAILVPREQLPALAKGSYYWADLEGLSVELEDGTVLGTIVNMVATGANDVMVVQGDRERLIPFVPGQWVKEVRLDQGAVVVDWDPEF